MNQADRAIWKFLLKEKRFFRFGEIKNSMNLHDNRVNTSLKRLEKDGLLVREISTFKRKPISTYLGIDPRDPKLEVNIVNMGGNQFCAVIKWLDNKGSPITSVGINLGDLGEYARSDREGLLYLEFPKWISNLTKIGKIRWKGEAQP